MSHQFTDTPSHRRDQIANFAEILKNAPARQKVFEAVYFGKKKTKLASEIATATGFTQKRVTMVAKPLCREGLFEQAREKRQGKSHTVYNKIGFVESNKRKILNLARNKKKLEGYHTKTNPKTAGSKSIQVRVPFLPKTQFVTIDDVDQFAKAKKIKNIPATLTPERLPEKVVKAGILKLLQELKTPKDWGGETNDAFSVKLKIGGKPKRAAFALKGPAKTGPLVPGMMGKNGDQIQRLFGSPAEVFFVQYEGEITESIIGLMEQLAKVRALLGGKVWFGTIDRDATYRLRLAYPKSFEAK
jgi:hypothetical protein